MVLLCNDRPLSLARHYRFDPALRRLAFKYSIKSADQAVSVGAYDDGVRFAREAYEKASNKSEFRVLLKVLDAGLEDIRVANKQESHANETNSVPSFMVRRLFARTSSTVADQSTDNKNVEKISSFEYKQLRKTVKNDLNLVQQQKESLTMERFATLDSQTSNESVKQKQKIAMLRQQTTKLDWQPSYAIGKLATTSQSSNSFVADTASVGTTEQGTASSCYCSVS